MNCLHRDRGMTLVEALVALALMALVILTITRLMAVVRHYLDEAQNNLAGYEALLLGAAPYPTCRDRAQALGRSADPGPPPSVWVQWSDITFPLPCQP